MNRNDAKGLYLHMAAIWPAASSHSVETTAEWVNYLSELPDADAQAGVKATRLECDFFPSFADFNRAVLEHRERRVIEASQERANRRELEAGEASPEMAKKFLGLAKLLGKERAIVISAKMLDDAKVENWRERLSGARLRDFQESRYAHEWANAWDEIRSEYRAAVGK